jgi:hypothetical protein
MFWNVIIVLSDVLSEISELKPLFWGEMVAAEHRSPAREVALAPRCTCDAARPPSAFADGLTQQRRLRPTLLYLQTALFGIENIGRYWEVTNTTIMKWVSILAVLLLCLAGCGAKTPDLSGNWKLDVDKSNWGNVRKPSSVSLEIRYDDPVIRYSGTVVDANFESEGVPAIVGGG